MRSSRCRHACNFSLQMIFHKHYISKLAVLLCTNFTNLAHWFFCNHTEKDGKFSNYSYFGIL